VSKQDKVSGVAAQGISMGVAIAIVISWERSHSILWAIAHGTLSWFYVVWFAIWGRA
jgi:hypothetical protein